MEYTPQEVAKLLANRPHQPHYVEWLLEQCLKRELAAEREGIAHWLAAQRNEIPATGEEFAQALRARWA